MDHEKWDRVPIARELDVLNFLKHIPNFLKNVSNFLKNVHKVPKSISRWETTSINFSRVLKRIKWTIGMDIGVSVADD